MSAMDISRRYRIIDEKIYGTDDSPYDSYYGDYPSGGWLYVCKDTPENREKLGLRQK